MGGQSWYSVLAFENLCFSYPGRFILQDVTMSVGGATILCILGSNGVGKTTLLNLIGGFVRPTGGTIRFNGRDLARMRPHQRSRLGIARSFQDLRLIGGLSVRDNLALSLPSRPTESLPAALVAFRDARRDPGLRDQVDALIASYCLTDVADQPANQISFGQQKLLSLAACVATESNLLLLDEPVAGISGEYREMLAHRIVDLGRRGKTIILVEHQSDFIERVGTEFWLLERGKLRPFPKLADANVGSTALRPP